MGRSGDTDLVAGAFLSAAPRDESESAPVRFDQFDLSEPILRALADQGYEHATPIQEGTIEHLLRDRDVVGQAQTGTGKTAAFMLPILERIAPDD
jgi:ATP-dependent RNA helicase DeaD